MKSTSIVSLTDIGLNNQLRIGLGAPSLVKSAWKTLDDDDANTSRPSGALSSQLSTIPSFIPPSASLTTLTLLGDSRLILSFCSTFLFFVHDTEAGKTSLNTFMHDQVLYLNNKQLHLLYKREHMNNIYN